MVEAFSSRVFRVIRAVLFVVVQFEFEGYAFAFQADDFTLGPLKFVPALYFHAQ